MVELSRFIRKLSRDIITPDFLARELKVYQMGIENINRALEAIRNVSLGLTLEEKRLANQYDILYLGGQRPNMTDEDEQRLISQISALFPGAREAYEKRERLFDEAYLPQKPSLAAEGEAVE